MKRLPLLLLLGGILALGLVGQATAGSDDSQVLEFKTMAPVVSPFTGAANPVRGINGGGVPWQLASAKRESHRRLPRGRQLSDASLADHGRQPGDGSCSRDDRGRRNDRGEPRAADAVHRTDRLRDERDGARTRRLVRDHRDRLGLPQEDARGGRRRRDA